MEVLNSIDSPQLFVLKEDLFKLVDFQKIKKDDIILRSTGKVVAITDPLFSLDLQEGTLEAKVQQL